MKIKNKYRIFTVLLIFSMFFSLFACNKNDNTQTKNNDGADNSSTADESAGAAEEVAELKSPIPNDVKFDGAEIRILSSTYFPDELAFMNVEEEIGEVVNDTIYRRNLRVQSDLNVNFKFTDKSLVAGDNVSQLIRNSVNSGSDDFDIIIGVQYDCVQLATSNMFANLIGAPYINLDNPWWPNKYIQEVTIGKETLYFLAGHISLNFIRNMGCAYFNKQLYSDYFGDPDDMYKLVLDGKWTLDKLSEMGKVMYKDLNGNGEFDNNDQYAYGVITSNLTDHFTYAAGIRVTARDTDGLPYFIMNNERTISYTEKLYSLFYENEGGRVFVSAEETNNVLIPGKFMNNELLFDFGWFYISELLRDMKTDYGIIPFPKYDENQPTYLSLAHDIVPLYCVPTTCNKMEAVGAVLEAMAFESYKSVLPAYFEIALKLKYTRDATEDAFKIIDMIYDNCTTDFAYVYNYALNGVGLIMREIMGAKNANFASRYERIEIRAQTNLEKLIDTYLNNSN